MLRQMTCAAILGLLPTMPLAAQTAWGLAVETGPVNFGGTSRATPGSGESGAFQPDGTWSVGVRLDRDTGPVRLSVLTRYLEAGLALQDTDVAFIARSAPLKMIELAPEVSWRAWSLPSGSAVWIGAGPSLAWWTIPLSSEGRRLRLGAHGAVSLATPLAARWSLAVRLAGAFSPSLFVDSELPTGYERRAQSRTELSVGLRRRL